MHGPGQEDALDALQEVPQPGGDAGGVDAHELGVAGERRIAGVQTLDEPPERLEVPSVACLLNRTQWRLPPRARGGYPISPFQIFHLDERSALDLDREG